jgi:hypothetical protein
MKKSITSTLALMFVLSTAGTAFAAANSVSNANELERMNDRINALENQNDDRVQLSGTARVRYEHEVINNISQDGVDRHVNLELVAKAKINDDWNAVATWEGNKGMFRKSNSSGEYDLTKLYVTGPMGGTVLTVGKFGWAPGYGIAYDNDSTGATLAFGNKVKTTIFAGDPADLKHITGYGLHSTYAVNPKTNVGLLVYGTRSGDSAINADTYDYDTNLLKPAVGAVTDEGDRTVYELGFDTKLNADVKLTTAYAKSSASDLNTNYKVQVDYKGADSKVENSYGAFVKYAKYESAGAIKPGGDIDPNQKGVQIGFDYVPMKNTKFSFWHFDKEFITTGIDDTKYRAQMEFYF